MKLKNILLTGLAALALTACDDFLTVDAPSSYTEEFVYSQKSEMNRALNGVYASILVGDLYGNALQQKFILNSDVEMTIDATSDPKHNAYARFDCDDQGGEIGKLWNAGYKAIEDANRFIKGMENSPLYSTEDAEIMQMIGEAKCLRAMVYHDLVVMFGDIPFTFEPSAQLGNEYVIPIMGREEIQTKLIEDLKAVAPTMNSSSATTVERANKEFAQALIARIALTAGGYSLRPDGDTYGKMERPANYKEFYQIAQEYAGLVINGGVHKLGNNFQEVFTRPSNFEVVNNGDVIFELPFAKEANGSTGYLQGPTSSAYEGATNGLNVWGEANGGARLNAFYPYFFEKGDKRRDFVCGLWYYGSNNNSATQDSCYIRADYTVHNNKWSKLWSNPGQFSNISSGNTGINFPYMRLADVLLMYAEASNELNNGPTAEAKAALQQVRARAFDNAADVAAYVENVSGSKEQFLKAVLDERKFELAGENSRWRDLVRNNIYGEELVYTFLRYLEKAFESCSGSSGQLDAIEEHDGKDIISAMPASMYYHVLPQNSAVWKEGFDITKVYGYPYPNKTMDILYIWNPFEVGGKDPLNSDAAVEGKTWSFADFYIWGGDNGVNNQIRYSFYGYIRYNENDQIILIKDGAEMALPDQIVASQLPPVRYMLPYPNAAIQRSAGAYKNYYGYK